MAGGNGGSTTTIVVALIGLVGVLGAAFIASGSKLGRDPTPAASGNSGAASFGGNIGHSAGDADNKGASIANGTVSEPPATTGTADQAKTYPDFSGNWVEENSASPARASITQDGNTVTWGSHVLKVRPDGTVGYQSFAAGAGAGHSVATTEQADLIDTFSLAIDGQELIFTTIFDVRHPYGNMPLGTSTRVMKYLREQ